MVNFLSCQGEISNLLLSHRRCISNLRSKYIELSKTVYRIAVRQYIEFALANISTLLWLGGGCCFCYSCHFQRGTVGTGCAVSATNRHLITKISIPSVGAAIGCPYFYATLLQFMKHSFNSLGWFYFS